MGVFAKRALPLPRFVEPVTKFIRKNMHDWDDKKLYESEPVNFPYQVPGSPLASS